MDVEALRHEFNRSVQSRAHSAAYNSRKSCSQVIKGESPAVEIPLRHRR
jgi:hypothetical protein